MRKMLFATFTACLCLLTLTACSGETAPAGQPQAQQSRSLDAESVRITAEARKAYEQFDYDRAIELYTQALEKDSENYAALSGKGVALAMRGNGNGVKKDVADGITCIEKALQHAPDDPASCYNLALAYKIDGRSDEAVTYFQKVIDADPSNTWSYYGIATIYGDRGDAANTVTWLRRAVELDGENVRNAARTQTHFDSVRRDKAFRELIYGEE